ncbi:hypothetical protein [Nocardioides hwasunensis]|uniref:Uncharacterized protein n=1 Tax=Nocardioides hwasunensis TaxID=397258 RepID=A0ABR8MFX1_9ACTN|nr:hypothetical protein [Nocardioides hwasunensis]MBD3914982.1 hypothetical protein [Nocardioides hwasunensis]
MILLRPPLHMGALHPFEQLLTVLLAFGPVVVLAIVVWRRTRADAAADAATVAQEESDARESPSRTDREGQPAD